MIINARDARVARLGHRPKHSCEMNALEPFLRRTRVAYFSMEIALREEMHTYSGGLGVLAGDTARSCADLDLPVVFVTLISRKGYLRQAFDAEGRQVDESDPWDPLSWLEPLDAMIAVPIGGRDVWIRPWLLTFSCPLGTCIPILFLDTDVDQNEPADRQITDALYGGDDEYRFKQEIILGIGGAKMLETLGFEIATYHMNEGHAALLSVELLRRFRLTSDRTPTQGSRYDVERIRDMCVFTTHTPVGVTTETFSYDLVQRLLGPYTDIGELRRHGGEGGLNLTLLALNLSSYVNGVARRHAETTAQLFPGYKVHAITNGVHPGHWTHRSFAALYHQHYPNWQHEPESLAHVERLPDQDVWKAHSDAKADLIGLVHMRCGIELSADLPILGFARRMTGYKRPDLLFTDPARLLRVAREQPFQIVLAGKAHPRDAYGKQLIEFLNGQVRALSPNIRIAFIPNYDLTVAVAMVSGSDVWLNTPLPPLEASGTSGMKAAFNGVLNASVLDGWWLEACVEDTTGWAIGADGPAGEQSHAADLYRTLEEKILPRYYRDQTRWIWMMKQAISKIAAYFNSQRMMRRYAAEAYVKR
jgi:starch phosphorylase